jgi:prolyl-tRNA synthetase
MSLKRGVEVGNIFKLGTRYTEAMGANFLDQNGESKPVIMGSYGIGSGRLMASITEEHYDDYGIIWPLPVAPYAVHLVVLHTKAKKLDDDTEKNSTSSDPLTIAEGLYEKFQSAGIEILFDDRHESPGVKFNDADLIGNPIRITVSQRSIQSGGVEIKRRDQIEKTIVPLEDTISHVQSMIKDLQAEIDQLVVPIPFEE